MDTKDTNASDPLRRRLAVQLDEARRLHDEARGLTVRQLLPGSTRLVLAQLPSRVSLAEAAGRVAEAYNLLHGGVFNRAVRRGGEVHLRTDDRGFAFATADAKAVLGVMEETLLFTHALLSLVAPAPAAAGLVGVSLRRARGRSVVPFGQMARVRSGAAAYALRYDAGLADAIVERPPREDLTYEAVIRTQITLLDAARGRPSPLSADVASALRRGAGDQVAVASMLGVSAATLRRRLAEEGRSFRDLKTDVTIERADALLATSLPLAEIAERLGFADVRSFNRSYRVVRGLTPAKARRGTDGLAS